MIWPALIAVAVLGLLLWLSTRRTDEAVAAHHRSNERWLRVLENRDERWEAERRQLLNRIQAPEKAVYDDFEPSLEKAYVGHDDDEAYWEAVKNGGS